MMMMTMMMIPIEVTLVGIVTFVSPEHEWNAEEPNENDDNSVIRCD